MMHSADNSTSKVLIIVNPVSGNRDKADMLRTIRRRMTGSYSMKVYKTTGREDVEQIKKLGRDFNPERVLVLGGDGTIKIILEALEDLRYVLGIIPAGSSNGLATDLDLPSGTEEALSVALGARSRQLDLLQLNKKFGLHISDIGINAELIEKYSKNPEHGNLAYLRESLPTLAETDSPYEFTLQLNGRKYVHTARMVAFANSRKYGTGAVINPHGRMDDGVFEVVVFKELKLGAILQTLLGNLPMDPEFVSLYTTRSVNLTTPYPVRFQIDGEFQGAVQEVSVEILPRYVKVAVG